MENRKIKILAIDDNQDNLISIKALIKDLFPTAQILLASSGAKGLELAAAENPDVILLDVIMPGMDGYEVCYNLKSDNKLSDIPVVFVTANKGDKESRILALESGGDAFLAKPIDESELTAQIRSMLKIRTANLDKRDENQRLNALVAEQTLKLTKTNLATLNLLEDLRKENEAHKKSVQALRESEERFRTVTQSANDAIITSNSMGTIIGWNKGAETIFGYAEGEIIGKNMSILIPEKYAELHAKGIARVTTGGAHHVIGKTVELHGQHKNGNVFPLELSLAAWETASGKFFTGIIRDITARKQSEAALKDSEKRYRGILANLDAGVVVHAPDTSIIICNPKASELLGLSESQIAGRLAADPHWQFIDEYGNPLPFSEYPVNQIKTKKKTLKEFYIGVNRPVTQDVVWLMVNGFPALDENGEISEIVISFIDLTGRKQAADLLHKSEEKYKAIFDNVQDVFYQTDLGGRVLEISPSIKHFSEFNREEIIGNPVENLYYNPEDRGTLLQEILKTGELRDYESMSFS
jgi:PAS domain S-box-containing protein